MRRCLLMLMICLLPLRLWAGDAMAVQHAPATTHEAAVVMGQDAHPCHGADAPLDVGVAAETGHASHDTQGNTAAGACGDCSVCHGPLAGLPAPVWAAKTPPAAVPQTVGWSALSATALPQLKPPRA